METTPNLGLPLLESDKEVSEEHHKINIFVKALDARLGEVAVTLGGLAAKGHDHEQGSINGLVEALALLAAKDTATNLQTCLMLMLPMLRLAKSCRRLAKNGDWAIPVTRLSRSIISSLRRPTAIISTEWRMSPTWQHSWVKRRMLKLYRRH